MKESPTADEEPVKLAILENPAVDAATLKELRVAYRDLRAAYGALHAKHHERIEAALAERKEDGKKTGGDVPYGYRLDKDGETLIEDEEEQAVIAEAVKLRAQNHSLRSIARQLWKMRLKPRPVPKAKRSKTKRAGLFDPTQIRRMIEAHEARAAEE